MNRITKTLAGIALGCCMASSSAYATIIKNLTIEEIGAPSGGLGTSALSTGGGRFAFSPNALHSFANGFAAGAFTSAGSTDGSMLMGATQSDLGFTPGFLFAGLTVTPNTLGGAPGAVIESGHLMLDISGWSINVSDGLGYFPLSPDTGTLLTSVAARDATSYFYTANWTHRISDADDPSGTFVGLRTFWHLEGIATTAQVPEPGTFWLVGATLLGFIGSRQRRLI
ncbi:MAG: PEP-CTERM sorting domain-containing protein [Thiobacillus sp.]|nr:PEP-CTERM sorting domain-containing protein [Thiobacillus sp.]